MDLGKNITCEVLHTPGHSRGSVALIFENEKAMITGDALPVPNDLPIYEDLVASVHSIKRLKKVKNIELLLSSWEAPIQGCEQIQQRIDDGLLYLRRIHEAVLKAKSEGGEDLMELCRYVVKDLGLPLLVANPLVARSFAANLAVMGVMNLFEG